MPGAIDNRTTAFRVPISDPAARRVENRLPSSDANPYLALAASLACGWLGMVRGLEPSAPTEDSANGGTIDLPRGLLEAVALLESDTAFHDVFSKEFVGMYAGVKRGEFETFMQVIQPVGAGIPASECLARRSVHRSHDARSIMPIIQPRDSRLDDGGLDPDSGSLRTGQ